MPLKLKSIEINYTERNKRVRLEGSSIYREFIAELDILETKRVMFQIRTIKSTLSLFPLYFDGRLNWIILESNLNSTDISGETERKVLTKLMTELNYSNLSDYVVDRVEDLLGGEENPQIDIVEGIFKADLAILELDYLLNFYRENLIGDSFLYSWYNFFTQDKRLRLLEEV